jgi:membrane-associated protein
VTDLLTMMATPAWAYLAVFGLLAVDALVPVVPTQAIMITAGALTVYGGLSLPLVIAVGAVGMFTGDLACFLLGRTAGHHAGPGLKGRLVALRHRCAKETVTEDPPADRGTPAEPARARRAAARFTRGLRKPGPLVVLLCRFVPGGRMAAGYQAGRKGYPVRLFLTFDGIAAVSWATYGGLVGHIGGTALTQTAWRLFAVAAVAATIFGTSGWVLALFGGGRDDNPADDSPADDRLADEQSTADGGESSADQTAPIGAPAERRPSDALGNGRRR